LRPSSSRPQSEDIQAKGLSQAAVCRPPPFPSRVLLEPDTRKAGELALSLSGGRVPIVIAGSLFLIGEVKRLRLFN